VVVGSGDDASRLKEKAASTGHGASILFTGQVSDKTLQSIYQRAAVFTMPSRAEGFGLVYLEAMKHRLPCIGSTQDAATEIIEDQITGFLIDQSDLSGLAQRIVTLLRNPSRRQEMGESGHLRLQEFFSFDRFRQRFLEIIGTRFRIG
jgi:glycosyltransferase involved in cell wall biosynthesis